MSDQPTGLDATREALVQYLTNVVDGILERQNAAQILSRYLDGEASIIIGRDDVTVAACAPLEVAQLVMAAAGNDDDPATGLYM